MNLLLFGTSFTNQPRITARQLDQEQIGNAVTARLIDFERALAIVVGRDSSRALPERGENERLLFARQTLGEVPSLRARLLSMLERMVKENETHARLVQSAEALGDPSLEFAERSRIYRTRGLSSDTSIRTNFAVEEALKGLTLDSGAGVRPHQRPRTPCCHHRPRSRFYGQAGGLRLLPAADNSAFRHR